MPRLRLDPAHGVEPVVALVERGELAARAERAADALDEHLEAALRVDEPVQQADAPRRPYGVRTSTVGIGPASHGA